MSPVQVGEGPGAILDTSDGPSGKRACGGASQGVNAAQQTDHSKNVSKEPDCHPHFHHEDEHAIIDFEGPVLSPREREPEQQEAQRASTTRYDGEDRRPLLSPGGTEPREQVNVGRGASNRGHQYRHGEILIGSGQPTLN